MSSEEQQKDIRHLYRENSPEVKETELLPVLGVRLAHKRMRPARSARPRRVLVGIASLMVVAVAAVGVYEAVVHLGRGTPVVVITDAPTASLPPTSTVSATKTAHIDLSAAPANAQGSTIVRLSWTPSTLHTQQGPEASAVFSVSPDGQTIAIAEAPDRNSRTLHLYDGTGTPLLSRPLLANIPHDPGFVALTDLAVISPAQILLLLWHEDSFRVQRLTPNETGMSTDVVHLTQGVADQLVVPTPDGREVWVHDSASDRSYPIFLGGQAIWKDTDQKGKARVGIPLGDTWVELKREDARITLGGTGSGRTWSVEVLPPEGERFVYSRLLRPDASGLLYLVTEIRPTAVGHSLGVITIFSLGEDGTEQGRLTLADTRSSVSPQFALTDDGTLYALWSTPGALEVVTYPQAAWTSAAATEPTTPSTSSTSERETTTPVLPTSSSLFGLDVRQPFIDHDATKALNDPTYKIVTAWVAIGNRQDDAPLPFSLSDLKLIDAYDHFAYRGEQPDQYYFTETVAPVWDPPLKEGEIAPGEIVGGYVSWKVPWYVWPQEVLYSFPGPEGGGTGQGWMMPIFSDLNAGSRYYLAIGKLLYRGVVEGSEDQPFRPEDPITVAEFAKMAVIATAPYNKATFSYPAGYIEEARKNGIASWGAKTAAQSLTRLEVALAVAQIGREGLSAPPAGYPLPFSDVPGSAKADLALLTYNGVIAGSTQTSFNPDAECSRGQASRMLALVLDPRYREEESRVTTSTTSPPPTVTATTG